MPAPDRSNALDHIVVVLFENRSLDNVLGHLYGPADGKNVDGVIGKDLTNPIPGWAERGADRKVVPHTVATDMDSPNPDAGEEYFHTNTQLYGILNGHNRFKIGEAAAAPWNAPPPGAVPTMDGLSLTTSPPSPARPAASPLTTSTPTVTPARSASRRPSDGARRGRRRAER